MVLALNPVMNSPPKPAAESEQAHRHPVAAQGLFANLTNADTLIRDGVPVKVSIDQFVIEADRLKDLRAAVGLHRGDAHLRENLEQAFVNGFNELALGRRGIQSFGKYPSAPDRPAIRRPDTDSQFRLPKPIGQAKWCTSRGSPVSTVRPTSVLVHSRTRW